VQLGGASGTLASFAALYGHDAARQLPTAWLLSSICPRRKLPWHTSRRPITRTADILVAVIDALGMIASDVALGARSETACWSSGGPGRGGSSAMPHSTTLC